MKVPGRPFYNQAGPQIRDLARRTAERVAEQYLKELEGGTDFASVTVTFSYAVSREEFMELEEAPPIEEFRVRKQLE